MPTKIDKSPIDRIMQGEDPKDIVNELMTTANSLGTKMPKPMGVVKNTRKKDKDKEKEE